MVPAHRAGELLFDPALTYRELTRRFDAGARIVELAPGTPSDGGLALFAIGADGALRALAPGGPLERRAGDRVIALA